MFEVIKWLLFITALLNDKMQSSMQKLKESKTNQLTVYIILENYFQKKSVNHVNLTFVGSGCEQDYLKS